MTSSREHGCREVDLDRIHLQIKHADKLLIFGSTILVIEETSNPKIDDVRKVVETIEWLIAGGINHVMADREPWRYHGIVHARRRVDDLVYRALVFEAPKTVRPIHVVKCNETLQRKVNEILQTLTQA
jgi:predicted aldo/keto reductase-like oxidoreductase